MSKISLTNKQKYAIGAAAGVVFLLIGIYAYRTPRPRLIISDQTIQHGQITVEQINLPFDGWIILSATEYDQPTEMVGKVRVERGRNRNVGIYVNVLRTTPRVEAAVYADKISLDTFDPDTDKPVVMNKQPLKVIFNKQ